MSALGSVRWIGVLVLAALIACTGARAAPRTPGGYDVSPQPAVLLEDDAAFARFAAELRADLEAEEAAGGGDAQARKDRRFDLALLDGLDGDWAGANARLDAIVAEAPPSWMLGLTIRAWADAGGTDPRAFRRALAARIATMPLAEVAESLAVLRELARQLTPERSRTLVAEHVGPAARRGPITRELASAIVFQRWAVVRIAPVAREIEAVVSAVLPAE